MILLVSNFIFTTVGASRAHKDAYNTFAKDNSGIFRIYAIDCQEFSKTCEKEGIKEYPGFKIFPPNPIPAQELKEEFTPEGLKKAAARFIEPNVVTITSANHDTFIQDSPGKAKVILFTNKKGIPLIYKALSANFKETLFFGIVREDESALAKKYKLKDYPEIHLIKNAESKPQKYTGAMEYNEIFNFINVYSEVFDFGEAKEPTTSAATKPWLSEPLPELHQKSGDDLCFKKDAVCVIYITNSAPSEEVIKSLKEVQSTFQSQLDNRGVTFSFMWLNANEQEEFAKAFSFHGTDELVALKLGKRQRYITHDMEKGFSEDTIGKFYVLILQLRHWKTQLLEMLNSRLSKKVFHN